MVWLALLFLLVVQGAWAPAACAWNGSGHMQIALMAWDRLSGDARANLAKVLRAHPRFAEDFEAKMPGRVRQGSQQVQDQWLFAHAATWPDAARGQPDYDRPRWHYINLPLYAIEGQAEALGPKVAARNNLALELGRPTDEASLNIAQALALSLQRYRDPSSTAASRAVALCWLLHLVGDMHQPAHSVSVYTAGAFPRGDRGGNRVTVGGSNLHAIWDKALGTSAAFDRVVARVRKHTRRHGYGTRCAEAQKAEAPSQWLQESQRLARAAVYSNSILQAFRANEALPAPKSEVSVVLDRSYRAAMKARARDRAVEAACRLASLLLADSSPAPPTKRWGCTASPGAPANVR